MAFVLTGYNVITGTARADRLNGTPGQDAMFGLEGNDTLTGNEGFDILDGGTGSDTMRGGLGNDIYVVDRSGDTTAELAGEGIDTVHATVSRTLGANLENLQLLGTANLNGTGNALDNTLTGNAGNNRLTGNDGKDKINGGNGVDTISGGNGDDRMNGEAGNDVITGGAGKDMLNGGAGDDNLRGGADSDGFFGGGGMDTLRGEAGNDNIFGDGGNDLIFGGAGNDFMRGGQMRGPSVGSDTFGWARADVYASGRAQGFDRIGDFGAGDKLDFSGLGLGASAASLVRVVDSASGSVVSAKFGSAGYIDVVLLDDVHVSLGDLIDSGSIVF